VVSRTATSRYATNQAANVMACRFPHKVDTGVSPERWALVPASEDFM
jgi:hypothetical protein